MHGLHSVRLTGMFGPFQPLLAWCHPSVRLSVRAPPPPNSETTTEEARLIVRCKMLVGPCLALELPLLLAPFPPPLPAQWKKNGESCFTSHLHDYQEWLMGVAFIQPVAHLGFMYFGQFLIFGNCVVFISTSHGGQRTV